MIGKLWTFSWLLLASVAVGCGGGGATVAPAADGRGTPEDTAQDLAAPDTLKDLTLADGVEDVLSPDSVADLAPQDVTADFAPGDAPVDQVPPPDIMAQDTEPADLADLAGGDVTPDEVPCIPTGCADLGVECGAWDDGCGETLDCGTCAAYHACEDGSCVPQPGCGDGICQPELGETCAGCPQDCGCEPGEVCVGGQCVCQPDCAGKACGDNGCGGACGTCPPGAACVGFGCVCQPSCLGSECGDDGCGGSCGGCGPEEACENGECVFAGQCQDVPAATPAAPEPLVAMSPGGAVETLTDGGFTDDYLYDGTGYLKVGHRREWGATIVFFGMADAGPGMNPSNTIDANDTGREVQVALYDPHRIMQGCAWNASCVSNPGAACPPSITYLGWNPVQGGNQCNIGSGVEWVQVTPGVLEAGVRPRHWNPDWEAQSCTDSACSDPQLKMLQSDVLYTQRLRFVSTHVVEMQMTVENLSDIDHASTLQEFPTLYATFGNAGTSNLNVLLDSNGQQIAIDQPANDGFFTKSFSSPGGWATLQNGTLDYGVGIYYENRQTEYQGWQKAGVFNNVRAKFAFGIPGLGTVTARAYLVLGSFATVSALINQLDATLPPFGALDTPATDAVAEGNLAISGWVLDNKGVALLEVLLDGAAVTTLPVNGARPDVCLTHPGYTMCDTVGFSGTLPLDGVSPCPHLLEIRATDTDGNPRIIARRRFFVDGAPLCLSDDDCDDGDPCTGDVCDPDTGCSNPAIPCLPATHPVHRSVYSSAGDTDHVFGLSASPPPGYQYEGVGFHLYDATAPGLVPLYQVWCAACTDHMQTLSSSEGAPAYVPDATLGWCATQSAPDHPNPIKRLYSSTAADHFVTEDPNEWTAAQSAGYVLESTLCYVP